MEESHFTEIPTEKIYSQKAIWLGAFLGGPVVAGYFISQNFRAFKDDKKTKITLLITTVTSIALFTALLLTPDNVKIPNQLIPLLYSGISYYITKHFQEQKINEHIKNGGEYFGGWETFATGFIGLLITLGVLFGLSFLL